MHLSWRHGVLLALPLLNGCAAVLLAPAIWSGTRLYNATSADLEVTVQVDTNNEARAAKMLKGAKSIVLVPNSPITVAASEYMEKQGVTVSLTASGEDSTKMSPSDRTRFYRAQCKAGVSAVVSIITKQSDVNTAKYILIGKTNIKTDFVIDTYSCRTKESLSTSGVAEINGSIQSPQQGQAVLGQKLGEKLVFMRN